MTAIELEHKRNFEIIKKNNLEVGTILKHKTQQHKITISSIHKLYGWVECNYNDEQVWYDTLLPNMRNLNDFYIQHKIRGELKWETKK